MPQKISKICCRIGCNGIVSGGVCSKCGPKKRQDSRVQSYHRGYGKQHRKAREVVFLRDCYICQICGKLCIEKGDPCDRPHKDHIIPLSRGGLETLENSQTLCGSCNGRKSDG